MDNAGGDGIKGKRVMGGDPLAENATQGLCSGVSSLDHTLDVGDVFKHLYTDHNDAQFRKRTIGRALSNDQEVNRGQDDFLVAMDDFVEDVVVAHEVVYEGEELGEEEGEEENELEVEMEEDELEPVGEEVLLEEEEEEEESEEESESARKMVMVDLCEDGEDHESPVLPLLTQGFPNSPLLSGVEASSSSQGGRRGTRSNPLRFEEEMARESQACDEETLAEEQERRTIMCVVHPIHCHCDSSSLICLSVSQDDGHQRGAHS